MNETRTLKVDPRLIFDVISKQAGTLGKAIMEGVMNAIDAGSTRCDVTLSSDRFVIADDGKGFVDRREIEMFFETFGTPHRQGDATYGRFRIGRGQMFAFGDNHWRSGAFQMNVDLRNRGLDYTLRETPADIAPGCRIEAVLYDRLSPGELDGTLREVKDLVAWAPIPVTLNGVLVSKDRAAMKWDYEDDDCLIALRDAGALKVYNLGMMVRGYAPRDFGGSGGIVVSKRQLEVNFARNDILTTQCEVWKRVRKVLGKHCADRTTTKKTSMTNDDRQFHLQSLIAGEPKCENSMALRKLRLLPTFPSGYLTLDGVATSLPVVILRPGDNERVAETVARAGLAKVLRAEVLDWCGCEAPEEVFSALALGLHMAYPGSDLIRRLQEIKCVPLEAVSAGVAGTCTLLAERDVTPIEAAALNALARVEHMVLQAFDSAGEGRPTARRLRIGESDSCFAWTDGATYIGFDRKYLNNCLGSMAGIGDLVATLLHEYLHDAEDTGTHVHDATFHERFHEVLFAGALGAQHAFLCAFYTNAKARGQAIRATLRKELDQLFRVADMTNAPEQAAA